VGLAIIYLERQQYEKALGALDKAQAADPSDADIPTARGAILLQAGRWEEARNMLREVLKKNSNDENALNALGTIAWQHEQHYAQAIDYFQRALRVHPASDAFNSSLHNSLGAVYCESGRCSEAIPHFQRAIELAPSDPEYHTNLGTAFASMGRFAEARAELERALALAPDYAPARASLAHLEEEERRAR
jgi:Tfp pilus assembly protein PilF